ncbi:MAG TPA: DUF2065 domain-containing protein [Steroidobacteraceae bacterium]
MDWTDLLAALAIVCIIEGILPFINPAGMKRVLSRMAAVEEREMRIMGLASMLVGLLVLFLVRS